MAPVSTGIEKNGMHTQVQGQGERTHSCTKQQAWWDVGQSNGRAGVSVRVRTAWRCLQEASAKGFVGSGTFTVCQWCRCFCTWEKNVTLERSDGLSYGSGRGNQPEWGVFTSTREPRAIREVTVMEEMRCSAVRLGSGASSFLPWPAMHCKCLKYVWKGHTRSMKINDKLDDR